MTYTWNGEQLKAVFALPSAIAGRPLRLAGAAQLKVLVWFAQHGGEFDAAACADAIGLSCADCRDAMQFWVEEGILVAAGDPPVSSPRPGQPVCTEQPAPSSQPAAAASVPEPLHPEPCLSPRSACASSPHPQFPDVVARQKACPAFDYLLKTAEQRLGRPLTHGEMESFLYIYETIGLPVEVILMLLVDVLRKNRVRAKTSLRSYLEKMAISWSQQGITTIAAAEQEFCREERRDTVREHIHTLFSMDRQPTLLQVETAIRWIDEWGFSDDLLLIAFERCREKTGGFQSGYMNRILEGWHADGITSAEQAREAIVPRRKSAARPLLSDDNGADNRPDEYERAAAAYRPVYKKAAD